MRYCPNCNTPLREDEPVCPTCQLDCSAVADTHEQEQYALTRLFRMMKYERLSWFIAGGVQLGLSVLMIVLLAFFFGVGGEVLREANITSRDLTESILDVIVYLPLGIVNLIIGSRITRYMDMVHCDIRPAYDRCTAVKTIVIAALFNEVALIFVIINFATAKSNHGLFEKIIHNQLQHKGEYH